MVVGLWMMDWNLALDVSCVGLGVGEGGAVLLDSDELGLGLVLWGLG